MRRAGARTIRLGAGLALLALLATCGGGSGKGPTSGEQARGHDSVGGQVISTVHGFAITVGEVAALARASGLSPQAALERLQAERLLMAEAERRGFDRDPQVREVARKAAVQLLLDELANAQPVTEDEVKEAYEKAGTRFNKPERRTTVHVLAKLGKEVTPEAEAAAKAYVAQRLAELAQAPDPAAFVKGLSGKHMPEFSVKGEALPPIARGDAIAAPYLDATFSLSQPGTVPEPVRTAFGWHAIRVLEIIPPEFIPYVDAAPTLRAELTLARQKQLVEEWLDRARKQQKAQPTEVAAKAMASLPP